MNIPIADLEHRIKALLLNVGVNAENTEKVTDVYMRASYREVGHHDIHDLLSRIGQIKEKAIKPNPVYKLLTDFGGIQCYDGDNALGELNSYFITEKSMELAELHGIGYCTIRNSNHFLAAAPFVEMADEKGFLTIVMSKSPGGLSLPGVDKNLTGNNPFGYAAGYNDGKLLFDICCAYSSFGKMQAMKDEGQLVPEYWGNDRNGQPSTKPEEILESGLYMPIGEHKGFGIALLVELLSSVLGDGVLLNQELKDSEMKGKYTQSALSIDIKKIMTVDKFKDRVQQMVDILRGIDPKIYIPGQRSIQAKAKIDELGYFQISDDLIGKMDLALSEN
ncbi:Ldh family oxidoreductase [Oceanispirochaeta crateris]|uniref:Ldh family oxidoreductase n=1 Tax=Oceanispirochaeta crateris TaxID=2518645 RepID=UPI00143CE069|nr:Ldh family oxidoreductase [Oceanispirochaeta crateris]